MSADRRNPTANAVLLWVTLIGGACAIGGTIAGGVVAYGNSRAERQHMQDEFDKLRQRVYDLEHANYVEHGDYGQLPNATKEPQRKRGTR